MIDKGKAWYKGEEIAYAGYHNNSFGKPTGYPAFFSGGHTLGQQVDWQGYIYTSLKDANSDDPRWNYVGNPYPSDGKLYGLNTWLRTGYANDTKMRIAESGGITESKGMSLSGSLLLPSSGVIETFWNLMESASSVLFCGIIGHSITINGSMLTPLDYTEDDSPIGNPEESGISKAVTLSTMEPLGQYDWVITQPSHSDSAYCSGAYIGSWSRLGVTQWTNHKKGINDYSKQEQDQWGNYSLSKRRSGRTYNAEVILTTRDDAVFGDYDYDIVSLCESVQQLLLSTLGTVSAFYFNNQDIGCPYIVGNSSKDGQSVLLSDTDIIVGVLQRFDISDIQGNHALLRLSVDSVPNEYQNYQRVDETALSSVAPAVNIATIPKLDSFAVYRTEDDSLIGNWDTLHVAVSDSLAEAFYIVPTPGNSIIGIYSIEVYNTSKMTITYTFDEGTGLFIVKTTGEKLPATLEYSIGLYNTTDSKLPIKIKMLISGIKNYMKFSLLAWDSTTNTYYVHPIPMHFYIST